LFVAIAIDLILNVLILVFRLHVWDSLVGDEFLFGDVGLVELLHPSVPGHGHGFTLLLLLWRPPLPPLSAAAGASPEFSLNIG